MNLQENYIIARCDSKNLDGVQKSNSIATILKDEKKLKKKGVARVGVLVGSQIVLVADVDKLKQSSINEIKSYWEEPSPDWESRLIFKNANLLNKPINIVDISCETKNKKYIQTVGYLNSEDSKKLDKKIDQ